MTDSLFFDSDCISAFLWVGSENLLAKLYSGKIVIPKPVYDELSYPRVAHLKARVDTLLAAGKAQIGVICTDTDDYDFYYRLTVRPDEGHAVIGKGEAASITLAKNHNGIIASNNLKDIHSYVKEYGLKHVTTGDILIEALKHGLITESQGNKTWAFMLARRRRLGAASFSDYLKEKQKQDCFTVGK